MGWDLSCPDWEQRLREGRSLVPDLPFWKPQADAALAVYRSMHLADVIGTPTIGEIGDDWVCDLVGAVFGSVDPATQRRWIREFFGLVPKKNNKTTGSALLMLTALLVNRRRRVKFILAGPTQDAAELAFGAAEGAIRLCPVKSAKLHVRPHLKRIEHRVSGAALEIMTFDPQVLTGQKPAGALIDEEHECAKMPKASAAMVQVRGGMIAYPEAFLIRISTQSAEAPVGIFAEDLKEAREIRDGLRTGDTLPLLYEFPLAMQRDPRKPWMDPATWRMVNPNWGRSIDAERLQALYDKALPKGEGALRTWASQHLNIEIGVALRSDGWAGAEYWEQRATPGLTLESLIERCELVTIGIDPGGTDDLLGAAFLGRERGTGRWLAFCLAYATPMVLKRRQEIAAQLQDFAATGDVVFVNQVHDAYADLLERIEMVRAAGLLPAELAIGIDKANHQLPSGLLLEAGYTDKELTLIAQGYQLYGAIHMTEAMLADGKLWHAGQALMAWSVGNAKVEPKGNAILITKQASGTAKIDPLMALLNAAELMARAPAAVRSIYDRPGAFAEAEDDTGQPERRLAMAGEAEDDDD